MIRILRNIDINNYTPYVYKTPSDKQHTCSLIPLYVFSGRIETRPYPIGLGSCGTKVGLHGLIDDVCIAMTLQ